MMSLLLAGLLQVSASAGIADIERYAVLNTLSSDSQPAIDLTLDESFEYIGMFDFRLGDVADGQRWIFVEFDRDMAKRLFIVQFEFILPKSDVTYNYSFSNAMDLGGFKFRQNPYAYSNKQAAATNPNGEAALTTQFLYDYAVTVSDEWMMSRYVMVPDEVRKHEMILFYVEMLEPAGYALKDFYQDDQETALWQNVAAGLKQRAEAAFTLTERVVKVFNETGDEDSGLEAGQYYVHWTRQGISVEDGEAMPPRDFAAHLRKKLNATEIILRKATMEQMMCFAMIARKAHATLKFVNKNGEIKDVDIPPSSLSWDHCRAKK